MNHDYVFLNSVMIWDDKKRKFVYEIGLPSRVVGVRLRTDRYDSSACPQTLSNVLVLIVLLYMYMCVPSVCSVEGTWGQGPG